jgi:hypothetical protein
MFGKFTTGRDNNSARLPAINENCGGTANRRGTAKNVIRFYTSLVKSKFMKITHVISHKFVKLSAK